MQFGLYNRSITQNILALLFIKCYNYILLFNKRGDLMSKTKRWILPDFNIDNALRISEKLRISLLTAKILCARGFSISEAEVFLNTDEKLFHSPMLLNDMQNAVDRINLALQRKEKIAIYGDYDVDGITATYILYDYLKSRDAHVIYYIPDRIAEGYGMNPIAIKALKNMNVDLIITVDVGITAFSEAEYTKELGMDLIITDHHSLKESLPDAVAVVNPKIKSSGYPFDSLAGVGVAFKLICALSDMDKKIFDKYCDIVAIGTIADMVPLKDENRYIAHIGIEKLKNTDNVGINAILDVAGVNHKNISSADVSFGIAPRLNAAGRMASAGESVELLLEKDRKKAFSKAEMLDEYNHYRQNEEQKIYDEAVEIIEKNNYDKNDFILVANSGWAHGIIGIVSSKITEKYYKPSAVVSINPDGSGKASGRSIKGINLFELLGNCSEHLVRFGGHELAAGFTVKNECIDLFRNEVNSKTADLMNEEIAVPTLNIDAVISLEDITTDNIISLGVLEPYGIENPSPVFSIEGVKISSVRITQNKKHAFVSVTDGVITRELPAFSLADELKKFDIGDYIDIAGSLNINTFKGVAKPQLIIRDIHLSDKNKYVSRNELGIIFSEIRGKITKGINIFDRKLSIRLSKMRKYEISSPKIQTALNIFAELLILSINETEDGFIIHEGVNFKQKTELSNSTTYLKYNLDNIK